MKIFFLIAAIVGAVVPYVYFIEHFQAHGTSLAALIAEMTSTPAAQGVTADATIASVVFWVFMTHRHRFAHGPNPILFVVINLAIGLSCALPAYLFAMELGRRPGAED